MGYLQNINSPEDVKKLNNKQLEALCGEIRQFLIENVQRTGGHIASNLGTVELTVALHSVFSSPEDKIVFDVGHQCYTHKILTGRREEMKHMRTYGGISGFPKPSESIHDSFKTGHSSTSISVAAGFAHAKNLNGDKGDVIAVIGDGALTGGMAFEALNDMGEKNEKIIVVLNDNEMSIDKNVGAMHSHFSKVRSSPKYYKFKRNTENFFNKVPLIGKPLVHVFSKVKRMVKIALVRDMFFEELGFTYIGLVDGHNIDKLRTAFKMAKGAPNSVVVHVITKKGKGWSKAEENPQDYHGISGDNANSGSNSKLFGAKLAELAEDNYNIVAITAAMASGTGLTEFEKKYPARFFDVGIAEQHAATMAGAMAASGFVPVFAVYSTFLQRAYDQIVHDMCLQGVHAVIAIDRAGFAGADGETHHGVFDIAFLRNLPGVTLLEPATIGELEAMIEYAIGAEGVVCVRYPRSRLPEGKCSGDVFKSEVLKPLGKLNIIACGRYVKNALKAAEEFSDVGVVNARTLKPLDEDTVRKALECGKVIVLEDGVCAGGYGSAILEFAAREGIKTEVHLIGVPERFIQHGTEEELDADIGADTKSIAEEIRKMIDG